MQLILTHENADFDAVAAQLAVHRLHPEATPLLARRVNRNVDHFLTLFWERLPFMRAEDWTRRPIDSVWLVDTQALPSVRGLRRDVPVTVFDHHVDQIPDAAWTTHVLPLGATTTLLVEQMDAAGLTLNPAEANLLLLGIYEDTGSLLYDTTTARDIRAAAWLLDQGSDLSIVRRFLEIPLSPAQKALFEQLHTAVQWKEIDGQPIALAAVTAAADFEDEISAVAHRLREMLQPAALVLLVQLKHHVQLVARSTVDAVDVAQLAQAFGGGGHSRAAAAIIHEPLGTAVANVLATLPKIVAPQVRVAEIMSHRLQTLPSTATVGQAAEVIRRLGHEGYPIVEGDGGPVVGLLTRRAVDRALGHQLKTMTVDRVMKAGHVTVRPDDAIGVVQRLMMEEGWGQIPVQGEDGQIIGIVTRTDVLNYLGREKERVAVPDAIVKRMIATFPAALWALVQAIGAIASEMQMPLYFVGGPVRDLLLGKRPGDIDLVVEGDAIALARRLRERYGGRVYTHKRFGTAKWRLSTAVWKKVPGGESLSPSDVPATLDFVTARTEFYRRPSALPEVEQSSIKLDLHRRDFTINTLAIRLDGAHRGQLLDFYGGQRDLANGRVRVLHSLSFIDDPTRILRAVRLEQRLDFTIEERTAELIASALPMLDRVTGDRIRHEIEQALREPAPAAVLARLDALDVLRTVHPTLHWPPAAAAAFERVPPLLDAPVWAGVLGDESPAFTYFALWMRCLDDTDAAMSRLKVRKSTRQDVVLVGAVVTALERLPGDAPASAIVTVLQGTRPRVLLAARAAVATDRERAWLNRYWTTWRHIRPTIDGHALRALGLKPGPRYGELLARLLAARLDGDVEDEAGERALLTQWLAEDATD